MLFIVILFVLNCRVISQPDEIQRREMVAVTGNEFELTPKYVYQFSKSSWVGPFNQDQVIENGNKLKIASITELNAGQYIFQGFLPNGHCCYSEQVLVYVGAKDYNRIRGDDIAVEIGTPVTLFCNSGGDTKWFFNSAGILPHNVNDSLKNFIIIKSFETFNAGIYSCYGKQDQTAESGHFVDFHMLLFYDQSKISQASLNLLHGQDATLTCFSSGVAIWFFNNITKLPDNVILSNYGRTLDLFSVTAETNEGYYECAGLSLTKSLDFIARALVTVEDSRSEDNDDSDVFIPKQQRLTSIKRFIK